MSAREATSLAPTLLLSMPQMQDENFERTVVLLCDHTAEGAFGLILNRPTTTAAAEVVAFDPPVEAHQGPLLWTGGPVEPQRGWILLGESVDEESQTEVAPGLYLSTSIDLLRRVVQATPSRTRVLTGYAGWGPGQLDDELAASAWLTVDVDPALIFDTAADEMWDAAIRRLGTEPGNLQIGQGVH
jgi:putative transcriptional regulator